MTSKNKTLSFLDYIDDHALMRAWHPVMRDERNVMRTTSLFWEVRREREDPHMPPLFTLKDYDHTVDGVVYISLKRIYFSYDHIPGFEYEFATDVFGSWDHWVKITKSSIRNEFQSWRDELEIKLKADAIKAMITASRTDDAKGVAAAKYLADKGYIEGKSRRGRPSREEVERERKIEAAAKDELMRDAERLGISIAK